MKILFCLIFGIVFSSCSYVNTDINVPQDKSQESLTVEYSIVFYRDSLNVNDSTQINDLNSFFDYKNLISFSSKWQDFEVSGVQFSDVLSKMDSIVDRRCRKGAELSDFFLESFSLNKNQETFATGIFFEPNKYLIFKGNSIISYCVLDSFVYCFSKYESKTNFTVENLMCVYELTDDLLPVRGIKRTSSKESYNKIILEEYYYSLCDNDLHGIRLNVDKKIDWSQLNVEIINTTFRDYFTNRYNLTVDSISFFNGGIAGFCDSPFWTDSGPNYPWPIDL